jgi:hypothetical protein
MGSCSSWIAGSLMLTGLGFRFPAAVVAESKQPVLGSRGGRGGDLNAEEWAGTVN